MTEKERAIKEKLWQDILKMIPIIIDDGKRTNMSPKEMEQLVDYMLDRVNKLKKELSNDKS